MASAPPDESAAAGAAAVELRDVRWSVGAARILDGVSVHFAPRRFHVVLGPNGAGKSTLLRIATGLLAPTSGEVRYDGRAIDARSSDALARVRAVLSQHVELVFPLAAEEVVMMGRYPHFGARPTARDASVVEEALALVGMLDRRAQPYPTLSGGERQKVQLARVLAQIWSDDAATPRYLFLDEPTASLDVHYQLHLLDVARSLLARGVTVIAILHDLNVALRYADHVTILDHGRVAWDAPRDAELPAELLERVFAVRARLVADPASGDALWRFSL